MSNMMMADNVRGFNLIVSGNNEKQLLVFKDSDVYGETDAEDCPGGKHDCTCMPKSGIYSFAGLHAGKEFHIGSSSPYPVDHLMAYGSWATATDIYKVNFHDFLEGRSRCGKEQVILKTHRDGSDYIPTHHFLQCEFDNVH